MDQRHRIEEAAEENEGPSDQPEPRESIVERIVARDAAVAAGIGSEFRRIDGRRLGFVSIHLAHQLESLAQLVQTPVMNGAVFTVLSSDGSHKVKSMSHWNT